MENKDNKKIDVLEESPKTYMEMGIFYYLHGKNDEAIAELKKAIKLKPDYIAAFFNLASILKELGRSDELDVISKEVAQAITKSLKSQGADSEFDDAKMHIELGVVLYIHGQYKDAENELRKAIAIDPNYILAYYNLAILLEDVGRHKEAVEEFRKAEKE